MHVPSDLLITTSTKCKHTFKLGTGQSTPLNLNAAKETWKISGLLSGSGLRIKPKTILKKVS